MVDQMQLKRLVVQSQMGNYLPLVEAVPYQTIVDLGLPVNFSFPKIDEKTAFYMVANGYLAYFDSHHQQLSLIQRGRDSLHDATINIDDRDLFEEETLKAYHQAMATEQDTASAKGNKAFKKVGSLQSMWEKTVRDEMNLL